MSTIRINNNSYVGNCVVITNGKDVTTDSKEITITVEGNIEELKVDVCNKVSVNGNVGYVKTESGDVDITAI